MKLPTKEKIISQGLNYIKNPVSRNIILVGLLTMIVKGFGFFKETVIASTYGLSEILDTFYIAVLIPAFINNVFLNAFGSVFIPNYVRESKINEKIGSFQSAGFLIILSISIIFLVVSILITDVYIETLFPGHKASFYRLIKIQFYYILPCIPLWGLSALISKLLNLKDIFTLPSIIGIVTPLSILIAIVFFKDLFLEKTLAIGTLAGSFFSFAFLLVLSIVKRVIILNRPNIKSDNAKLMFAQLPAKVSSGVLVGLIPVTDQFFAAQLAIGSIAALNFGLKIPAFLTSIAIVAINNVLLPYFSKMAVNNEKLAFENLFKILKQLFLISMLATIALILFSNSIVELLFERNSFTSEDTTVVSLIQVILLIYAPFTICGMVIVNFLTSMNKNNFMALVSFIGVVLNIILDMVLMKFYGIYGIAICTTLVVIIRFLILLNYTYRLKKNK